MDGEGAIYYCDIDNDGIAEAYEKRIWSTSNRTTVDCLEFRMIDGTKGTAAEAAISDCYRKEDSMPVMLWIDVYQGKNIVNVIYRTGLYDYAVEGYLIDSTDSYSTLYTIEGKTELSVEEIRTKEVPGKRKRMA